MKITYKQISKAINPLMDLSGKEMDYALALKISRNIRELEKHYEDYQEEVSNLQQKYLDRDEDGNLIPVGDSGNTFKIKDGKVEELSEKLKTLDEFEVEATVYMLNEEDFKDLKITPSVLMGMDFLIDDE